MRSLMQVKKINSNKQTRPGLRLKPASLEPEKSLNEDTLRKLEDRLRQLFQQDQKVAPVVTAPVRPIVGRGKVIRRRRGEQDKRISS